jgi:hypothetical protein
LVSKSGVHVLFALDHCDCVGLGMPHQVVPIVDEGRNRAARAKNRRVEVKVFSADQIAASLKGTADSRCKECGLCW